MEARFNPPPSGWRLLEVDEVIQEGDMYAYDRTISNWVSPEEWTPEMHYLGHTLAQAKAFYAEDFLVARKVEEPVTAIDPGVGYRLLEKDELVEQGDEVWSEVRGGWRLPMDYGYLPLKQSEGFTYRRPLPVTSADEPEPEKFPVGSKVRVKDDIRFYETAGHYGTVGEHWNHDEGWRAVLLEGRDKPVGLTVDELEPDTRPELEEGYRYLRKDEPVIEGDEFLTDHSGWMKSSNWACSDGKQSNFLYRRKITPKPVTVCDEMKPTEELRIEMSIERLWTNGAAQEWRKVEPGMFRPVICE